MKAIQKLIIAFMVIGMGVNLAGAPTVVGASGSEALEEFDAAVAQSRLEMRQYCALAQELMKTPDSEKQQTALSHLKQAAYLWEQVQAQYRDNPPAAYAADKQFAARLEEISGKFTEMEAHLAAGRFKKSFQACGSACGLFVQMHEENGLVYALDRLFHLRKTVKTAAAAAQNSGMEGVATLLPVMQQRDRVLEAPCPAEGDAEKCREYRTAVKDVSALIDELALNLANERRDAVKEVIHRLLSSINQAYGLAM